MKYIILNDIHFGCRNSSEIFIKYQETFFDYLIQYMSENSITHIIMLGDVFDKRRYIDYRVLDFVYRVFNKLKNNNIEVTITLGNHDVYYKDTNRLNSPNLLLSNIYDNVSIIGKCQTLKDHPKIGLVPWIPSSNNSDHFEFIKSHQFKILLGHFEIAGFSMYKDGIKINHGMNQSLFTHHDKTYSGHYHHKSNIGSIHYLGSQFQFTWADVNDDKYFHVMDTDDYSMTPIKVPFEMFVSYKDTLPKHLPVIENKYIRLYSDMDIQDHIMEDIKKLSHGFEQIRSSKKVDKSDDVDVMKFEVSNKAKLIQQYSKKQGLDDQGIAKFLDIYMKANS